MAKVEAENNEDHEDVPREEICFQPLAEAAVQAFGAVHERHCPEDRLRFIHCGNCDSLHIFSSEESGVALDIAPDMWERVTLQ